MLFAINREDNQLARPPELGHNHEGFCAINGSTPNQIFPLFGFAVFLPFDDCTRQNTAFNVENSQIVVVHFFFRVQGHDVLTATDFIAQAV